MAVKTNEEWQTENSELAFKLNYLKQNFDKLSVEHKILQTKLISEKEKNQECNKCNRNLQNVTNVKKLRNDKNSKHRSFECDKCEKEFFEEWKLSAHVKTHEKFKCDQCEKSFTNSDIKKKHVLITHENVKLYCHFFNNGKTCPFADKCIFLHKDSKFCRYDDLCERDLCMFKHRKKNEPLSEENIIIDNEEGDVDDDKEEDEIDEHDDSSNKTFINPTQVDDTESDLKFKCEVCDFRARSKNEVNDHKTTSHNWCRYCFSSFISQERLKKHLKNKHNKQ